MENLPRTFEHIMLAVDAPNLSRPPPSPVSFNQRQLVEWAENIQLLTLSKDLARSLFVTKLQLVQILRKGYKPSITKDVLQIVETDIWSRKILTRYVHDLDDMT